MDFHNEELLETFTNYLKKYVKKHKGIFLKIDPDIIIKSYDTFNNVLIDDLSVYNSLIKLNYKHKGFTKRFETSEPRFSFLIDFTKPFEEIENNFSKTTKQRIKKAEDLDIKVEINNNIDEFYNLIMITENRKDFLTHTKKYYEDLYNIFSKNSNCNIFLGSIDIDKVLNKCNILVNDLDKEINSFDMNNLSKSNKTKLNELAKRKENVLNDINNYKEAKKSYGNNIVLSAHFIVSYGDKAWVLYAGNHDVLSQTYTNYLTYYEHIKYYYNQGIKIYDQFGTVGELTENDPLLGLHEFKKKFGGDYVEFIGEFDLVTNKFMNFIFKKLVPFYRNHKFRKNVKKIHN